jgi:hypothetical protein
VRTIEIPWPGDVDCQIVEEAIDEAITGIGLTVTLRGSLKKFPGCIHWHARNGRESGTLEITLWPQQRRAWFTIQDGRRAPWIDDEMRRITEVIAELLNGA